MKRLFKFIGDTPWWVLLLLGPLMLGLSIWFTASTGASKLEKLGDTPEMKAAIRHEIKIAAGQIGIDFAKDAVETLRDNLPDDSEAQAALKEAMGEIEQAKVEIEEAKQQVATVKQEAETQAQDAIKGAQEQIKEAERRIAEARAEMEKLSGKKPDASNDSITINGSIDEQGIKGEIKVVPKKESAGESPKGSVNIGINKKDGNGTRLEVIVPEVLLPPGTVLPALSPELKLRIDDQVHRDARRIGFGAAFIVLTVLLFPLLLVTKGVISVNRRLKNRAAKSEKKAQQSDLNKQLMEAKLAAMQAQIEPHFLFNTLASVQHLIETNPPAAAEMQNNLIKYLRAAIPQMRESSTTLGREAEQSRAYLDILKVRMGERLAYTINIPDALQGAAFPPMMIPTLVENAIKHGLEPKAEGGSISVSATVVGDKLKVSVADTGMGFSSAPGAGVGLANIRERLKALYGDKANLIIMPNLPNGAVASIEIPNAKK